MRVCCRSCSSSRNVLFSPTLIQWTSEDENISTLHHGGNLAIINIELQLQIAYTATADERTNRLFGRWKRRISLLFYTDYIGLLVR